MTRCDHPIELGTLAAYRLGELDTAEEQRAEAHYFECEYCAARLRWLESLSEAVAAGVRAAGVSAAVSSAWVEEAENQGLEVRTYEIAPGGSVACTASPEDDFVVVRLDVGDAFGPRVDVETTFTDLTSGAVEVTRIEDVAVDVASKQLVYTFPGDLVRGFPKSRWILRVLAHGGTDSTGPYTMNHTPWDDRPTSS